MCIRDSLDPGIRLFHRPGFESELMHPAGAAAADQPRALEHAQMLGNGGEGNGVRPGQVGDAFIALREMLQNPAAGRISQSGEGTIKARPSMFNHMVK